MTVSGAGKLRSTDTRREYRYSATKRPRALALINREGEAARPSARARAIARPSFDPDNKVVLPGGTKDGLTMLPLSNRL
jgi:hypothetical protein